jgi:Diphthamide synthase
MSAPSTTSSLRRMSSLRSTDSPRPTPASTSGGRRAQASGSPVALSWSGGKDSALALWVLREELGIEPIALLTTLTEPYDRISMHAVRGELLRAQARATGVELVEIPIPDACVNEVYEERMAAALESPPLDRAETFAFADLFLADIRAYREERLGSAGRGALFPLWERDTGELARGVHRRRLRGDPGLRRPRPARPVLRRAAVRRGAACRPPERGRPLRRERRVPHLRSRRPDLRGADRNRARRGRDPRRLRLPGPPRHGVMAAPGAIPEPPAPPDS